MVRSRRPTEVTDVVFNTGISSKVADESRGTKSTCGRKSLTMNEISLTMVYRCTPRSDWLAPECRCCGNGHVTVEVLRLRINERRWQGRKLQLLDHDAVHFTQRGDTQGIKSLVVADRYMADRHNTDESWRPSGNLEGSQSPGGTCWCSLIRTSFYCTLYL